jgi:hypothetical protein
MCEGETEEYYFDGLKREDVVGQAYVLVVQNAHGFSPTNVVKTATKRVKGVTSDGAKYEEKWCVMDVEGVTKADDLATARAEAKKEGFQCALSNPAFEVWILAHFERTCRLFMNADAVISHLRGHWGAVSPSSEYRKADDRIYDKIGHLKSNAIKNARAAHKDKGSGDVADRNSSTDVYLLVERLLGTNPPATS